MEIVKVLEAIGRKATPADKYVETKGIDNFDVISARTSIVEHICGLGSPIEEEKKDVIDRCRNGYLGFFNGFFEYQNTIVHINGSSSFEHLVDRYFVFGNEKDVNKVVKGIKHIQFLVPLKESDASFKSSLEGLVRVLNKEEKNERKLAKIH